MGTLMERCTGTDLEKGAQMSESRVAVVTNVRHFVGLPIARELAAHGMRVVCHDSSFSDTAVCAAFGADHPTLNAFPESAAEDLIGRATRELGRVDVLVNNDAFPAIRDPVEHADPADFRAALDSLLIAPFLMSRAVVPQMKARQAGKILFITSAAPLRGLPNYSTYVAARGGANALVVSLARELAPSNIQVNAIAPNFVESPTYFPQELLNDSEALRKITRNIPLGRLAKPDELAALAGFLASPRSDFITGHVLPFAGGWA
jgi:NAD(P)-dependent dehydrogenase (short-subunit alcohol dehydrogenase family)